MPKYSVVIPVYNEEEVIAFSYERLSAVLRTMGDHELIFVDDGSVDGTLDILKKIAKQDTSVRIISFSRNFGHQEAVTAGIANASGNAVIIIDADMQDPPEILPDMAKLWADGADIVYGRRVVRKGESAFKKVTAYCFYKMLHMLGAQNIPRNTGDFRIIDRKVADLLNSMPERNRFLRGMSAWGGFKQVPFDYVRQARAAGNTKYTMKKMVKLAGDGVTSFSNRPLKFPLIGGITVSVIGFLYLIAAVVLYCLKLWEYQHIIFSIVFILIGCLFLSVGVLGIYLGRVYDEAKARPLYIINEKINF